MARSLNTNPAEFDGGPSLYTYVGNRPVDMVDPEGLQPPPFQLPKMPEGFTLQGRKILLPPFMPEEGAQEEDELGHPADYKVPPGKAKLEESWQKSPGQNCHGYVVRTKKLLTDRAKKPLRGILAIQDPVSMRDILKDAEKSGRIFNRQKGDKPQIGDIVVYGNFKHSGVVTGFDAKGPIVVSDWGDFGVYRHGVNDVQPAYRNQPLMYFGMGTGR